MSAVADASTLIGNAGTEDTKMTFSSSFVRSHDWVIVIGENIVKTAFNGMATTDVATVAAMVDLRTIVPYDENESYDA